jgi:alkylation response protein AidB-like acyl-CoA dehydrogenase
VVQSQIAQAEAHLQSARGFLYQAIGDAWESAQAGEIPLRERVALRLATTYAIQRSAVVVDVPYHLAGGTSVFSGDPLEQRFRDIHALTQQAQGRIDHYETVGQYLLGIEPEEARL